MFDNYAQAAHEYECAYERACWEDEEERDEFLKGRDEYEETWANEHWREWRDEMNIRQAEANC